MKEKKQRVLVVEDDEALMLGLEENFKFAGYEVLTAASGPDGYRLAVEGKPDVVLLDLMLPGMSGFDVCRKVREKGVQVPVLMLTARQDEFDKLHGFEMGADDYVTKPFSVNELLARVKAILKRGIKKPEVVKKYEFDDFVLDQETRTLTRRGKDIKLTRTEFNLLAYFLTNEGKALSRDVLMQDVWGLQYLGTQRSLDSFVVSLRGKIEKNTDKPEHIITVHGVGYKFSR